MTEEQKWIEASKDKAIMSDWETGKTSLTTATKRWNERKGTNLSTREFAIMARGYGFNKALYEMGLID